MTQYTTKIVFKYSNSKDKVPANDDYYPRPAIQVRELTP